MVNIISQNRMELFEEELKRMSTENYLLVTSELYRVLIVTARNMRGKEKK